MYWDSALHLDLFVESMSRERFFQLRSNFHVVDNLARPENCKDKLYKVRPIYDCIRRRCLELQIEEELCVDEQMILFKGRLGVKQYWSSIVLNLVERINREHAYLYFDNFFTTFNLLEILKIKNIYAAGTARLRRMPNVPFTSDKDLKKKGRGCGSQDEVQHREKSRKTYVSVSRPEVVCRYNHAMGGVDKIDMLIGMYRIFIKSRKWICFILR
ncbi:piggyBac transposable element-derived protein 3-like [Schistocerca piceifrons]|uniref:piggyBac transposable element-derived protein 3-like n=1 Tax=Schistocerca piceifrons TaxID=274613 RepID=UPI001F5F3322|nr:piggyBac transposable element-derived protein 3-like [Schistocerca piceifrons]